MYFKKNYIQLIQKFFQKLKYHILLINYKLVSKKNKGYDSLVLNKSIIKKTIIFSKLNSLNEKNINIKRTLSFL